MANYYKDHPEIDFHLNHPLMRRIAELKERGYTEKDRYEEAPVDFEDCIENYRRLLEIAGDIAANTIAPNSEDVDLEGQSLQNEFRHWGAADISVADKQDSHINSQITEILTRIKSFVIFAHR